MVNPDCTRDPGTRHWITYTTRVHKSRPVAVYDFYFTVHFLQSFLFLFLLFFIFLFFFKFYFCYFFLFCSDTNGSLRLKSAEQIFAILSILAQGYLGLFS